MSQQDDIIGRVVYLVSYGISIANKDEMDPDDGRGAVFTTEAQAKEYMMNLAKDLYWTEMDYNSHDDEDECPTPPSSDGYNRHFYVRDNFITFASESVDGIEEDHQSGYVKITKVHINNVVPDVGESFAPNAGEPSPKKRKV